MWKLRICSELQNYKFPLKMFRSFMMFVKEWVLNETLLSSAVISAVG